MRWVMVIGLGVIMFLTMSVVEAWDRRTTCYSDGLGGMICDEQQSPLSGIGILDDNERPSGTLDLLRDMTPSRTVCYPDGLGGVICDESR